MSNSRCPYCGHTEGRSVVAGGGCFLIECKSCGRVVEERQSEVEELFVERARDAPFYVVTPDLSTHEKTYHAPTLEEDPYENIGFITTFSTWSLEFFPLFTATSTTFDGQLAELERVLSDSLYSGGEGATNLSGASMGMVDTLRAYFQIVEVASVLGLDRDSCDHAIQLFRDCLSTTYLRNRNIEALATAALVQAMREAQEPRTLQEISAAANISQKEIGRHMKLLTDALKLSQPFNSNSISVHMPRFCNLLNLTKKAQDLATHIGEVVVNKSFCTRRNPISISAAAIYMVSQMEDKRKTQTEICKVTGLTEVTLRKVYKELTEYLDDLLPADYVPVVPLEKAFPGIAAALNRVCAARAAAGAVPVQSATGTSYPVVNSTIIGLGGGSNNVVEGFGASTPGQANLARAPVMASGLDRILTSPLRGSAPVSSDGRTGVHLFSLKNPATVGVAGVEAQDRTVIAENSKETERDKNDAENQKEKERDRLESDFGGSKKVNMIPSSPAPAPSFQPSFFPFAHMDPRLIQERSSRMWPMQFPMQYGPPTVMQIEEETIAGRGYERPREEGVTGTTLPNVMSPPQYLNIFPALQEGLDPSLQLKMLQYLGARPTDSVDRRAAFDRTELNLN